MAAIHPLEQLRSALGAMLGLGICTVLVDVGTTLPLGSSQMVVPLGVTAVLLFCIPNSPLAQPWSAVIGNVVSALVALAVIIILPSPWAMGAAVGGAILVMMLLRALHPPGGAIALLIAIDPDPVREAGIAFALFPVGLTTAALVVAATVYNRATGRIYPFRQVTPNQERQHSPRLGLTDAELEALLARFNQSTNMGAADLGRLLAAAEEEAVQHRLQGTICNDIMTQDLITVGPEDSLSRLASLFQKHPIKCLPVVNTDRALLGLVLQADLLIAVTESGRESQSFEIERRAADVMRPAERAVRHDLPVGALLHRLAAQGAEVVPVTRDGQLVGVLTRSDIIRLLLRGANDRQSANA